MPKLKMTPQEVCKYLPRPSSVLTEAISDAHAYYNADARVNGTDDLPAFLESVMRAMLEKPYLAQALSDMENKLA